MSAPEIVKGLAIHDEADRTSDWTIMNKYAEVARFWIRDREAKWLEVLEALIRGLEHEHTTVKVWIADCLGYVDLPEACSALSRRLLEPSLPREMKVTCLESISRQLNVADGSAQQLISAIVVLTSVRAAAMGRFNLVREIDELLERRLRKGMVAPLTVGQAIEVIKPNDEDAWRDARFEVVDAARAPLDPYIDTLLTEARSSFEEDGYEDKYRVVDWRCSNSGLVVQAVQTEWETGHLFHRLIGEKLSRLECSDEVENWLFMSFKERSSLPGLASVHGIVVTRDRRIVLSRRALHTHYAPGAWSVGFEEQITGIDIRSENPLLHAACRGFREEFGVTISADRVRIISGLLEVPNLNHSLVALLEPELTFNEIHRAWQDMSESQPELSKLDELSLDDLPTEDRAEALQEEYPLHPTSRLRLHLLQRFI